MGGGLYRNNKPKYLLGIDLIIFNLIYYFI